ncbi:MAG: SH3 domain-containing protein [Leptolyngbyaceae cyanobacterium CSU_1_3]|nr:SH3 domain-containing protein [Leptolyngbyaceae cyanobacterium CSU_1_3]
MSWSSLIKVFSGLFLAIALLAGGGLIAAQYLITKLSAPPPKPIYPNDKPIAKTKLPQPKPVASEKPTDTPDSVEVAAKPLPANAFEARVTQQIGLILRDAAGLDAGQIGGIEYNEKVTVLETSADGEWQKVRLQPSDREGWIKAGNVEKTSQ